MLDKFSSRTSGLITSNDSVIFDEVTSARFGDKKDFELIGLLKDFMEGGNVSRGPYNVQTDSSLMFLGNIDVRGNQPKFKDFTKDLPYIFQNAAFLDRIHAMIPNLL